MGVETVRSEPDGLASLRSLIDQAYFPYEITELATRDAIDCGIESATFGQLQVSHVQSNAAYRGRRRGGTQRSNAFVLHVMKEGSLVFNQGRKTIKADAGALVLIDPEPVLDTEKPGATEALALAIPADLLTMYFPDARNWKLSMRGSGLGSAAVLRELLECSWRQRDKIRSAEAAHLSRALIQLVGATFSDEQQTSYGSRAMQLHYIRIRDFVLQNLEDENLSADFVADKLNISKSHMFAVLKTAETTLGRLILSQRLERCREMLVDPCTSHISISEIAYAVGFRELPHFSRCFTRHYGASPRAFRKAHANTSN
jgi:AraC family transcriptional activator of tynA and feaB